MSLIKRIINHILKRFQYKRIPNNNNAVFLTFDDGPEPGITEFVLDELAKYNFKATFFCRGDNVEKYPELLNRIKKDGHAMFDDMIRKYTKSGEVLEGTEIINMGKGGTTINWFLTDPSDQIGTAISYNAEIYTLCYGINDVREGNCTKEQLNVYRPF